MKDVEVESSEIGVSVVHAVFVVGSTRREKAWRFM